MEGTLRRLVTPGEMQRGRLALEAAVLPRAHCLQLGQKFLTALAHQSLEDTLKDRGYRSDVLL